LIELRADREAALDAAYLACRQRLGDVSRADFAKSMERFEAKAGVVGGEAVGAVFVSGPEIHVAVLPRYQKRWASKGLIGSCLAPIFEKFGFATTKVMNDNQAGIDFVRRLGFVERAKDDQMTCFEVWA
jgi:hypothetical protein